MVQWLRICLAMQRTPVWSLVQEDPTCHGATKPVYHSYWASSLCARTAEPCATTIEAHELRTHAPQQEKPLQWEACAPQDSSPHSSQVEKAHAQQWRLSPAQNRSSQMENSRNKQFLIFKLATILSMMMKARTILFYQASLCPLYPAC